MGVLHISLFPQVCRLFYAHLGSTHVADVRGEGVVHISAILTADKFFIKLKICFSQSGRRISFVLDSFVPIARTVHRARMGFHL